MLHLRITLHFADTSPWWNIKYTLGYSFSLSIPLDGTINADCHNKYISEEFKEKNYKLQWIPTKKMWNDSFSCLFFALFCYFLNILTEKNCIQQYLSLCIF